MRRRLTVVIGVCCCALSVTSSHGSLLQSRLAACGGGEQVSRGTNDAGQVRFLRGPAPAALTDVVGVLREPRAEVVELPDSAVARLGFSEVWIDAVRRIPTSSAWGMRVFLIPGVSGDAMCAHGSPQGRANAGEPLVSMDIYEPSGRVGPRAYSAGDVVAGRAIKIFPLNNVDERNTEEELVLGLVPDNVSSVEVKVGDMPGQTVQVKDNFFEVQVPVSQGASRTTASVTTAITWYDSSGRNLKTISRSEQRMWLHGEVGIPGA
jgi:hypothetical protein